jgi:hypothetical protein
MWLRQGSERCSLGQVSTNRCRCMRDDPNGQRPPPAQLGWLLPAINCGSLVKVEMILHLSRRIRPEKQFQATGDADL